MKYIFLFLFTSGFFYSCETKNKIAEEQSVSKINPPAEGFNEKGSDQKAIAIADRVMEAMGGRNNWDKERFFSWNFFGFRTLWWDKMTGDVRIQMHRSDSTKILVNIFNNTGRVSINGTEMSHADSVSKYVTKGKGIWINDSYWLFMPFKLKDSGVTLTYITTDTLQSNKICDVLQMTFEGVGNTPQNKYHVWVDQSDHLVKQWAFYRNNDREKPNFINPWEGYKKYNSIYLSGNRGERQITDIQVSDHMDTSLFTEF